MTHAFLLGPDGFVAGAGLPLTDRGFRYGMSLFETIALRNRAPLLLERHLETLARAGADAAFRPPPGWLDAIRSALASPPIDEGAARIYLTAGDGGADVRIEQSRVALLFDALPIPTVLETRPAVTATFLPALPFGKTGNYWPHLRAQPVEGAEAILFRPDRIALGGAMSNLFLVSQGSLLTPAEPVRRGVVREWVRENFAVREASLSREDVNRADDAFLTNSRIGLRRLSRIDGRDLTGDGAVEAIWSRYRAEVLRAG